MSLRMTEQEYQNYQQRRGVSTAERQAVQEQFSPDLQAAISKANGKAPVPLEDQEQAALVVWLRQRGIRFHATPNGGHRSKSVAGKLKMQGVSPGFPDITIWPSLDCPGCPILHIELKRTRGGTVSDEQHDWLNYLADLSRVGYPIKSAVCKGFDEARQFILSWGY